MLQDQDVYGDEGAFYRDEGGSGDPKPELCKVVRLLLQHRSGATGLMSSHQSMVSNMCLAFLHAQAGGLGAAPADQARVSCMVHMLAGCWQHRFLCTLDGMRAGQPAQAQPWRCGPTRQSVCNAATTYHTHRPGHCARSCSRHPCRDRSCRCH